MKKILVTGGTGFIGSHTVVSLLENGHQVVILDNLCKSSINILPRLKAITDQTFRFIKAIFATVRFCAVFLLKTKSIRSFILPA